MPKKTRQQKSIAHQRYLAKILNEQSQKFSSKQPNMTRSGSSVTKINHLQNNPNPNGNLITVYFNQDLRKSVILIGFIIALEFLLYFASINDYFGNWLRF